jgi:hypothetical protein
MRIIDQEIDLWTAFVEDREFHLRNASLCHEPRLRKELMANRKVLEAMLELKALLDDEKKNEWNYAA